MDGRDDIHRLEVPATGRPQSVVALAAIIAFFVGVAIDNLNHWQALTLFASCSSVAWVLIVTFGLLAAIVEVGGVGRWLIQMIGVFSRRAFLEVVTKDEGSGLLRYGFTLAERRFFCLRINVARIGIVNWGPGQASDWRGRDMDDWTISLWCDRSDTPSTWDLRSLHDKVGHTIGPHMSAADADSLGTDIISLLRDAGVELSPGSREHEYVVEALIKRID